MSVVQHKAFYMLNFQLRSYVTYVAICNFVFSYIYKKQQNIHTYIILYIAIYNIYVYCKLNNIVATYVTYVVI